VFVIAEIWNGENRLFLDAAKRSPVTEKGEVDCMREIDLYYDPHERATPELLFDLIEEWKTQWIERGTAFGARVNVKDLEKAEQWLRDGADYVTCIERQHGRGKIYLSPLA
jgi:hypothetical protein